MLRAGFFENFKGADTLLIWGDEQSLVRFRDFLARLPSKTSLAAAFQEIEGVHIRPDLSVNFELGPHELRVDSNGGNVVVVASCSANMLAIFADRLAGLADPKCRAGHQYLEWPGNASIVVMVSKGEYPDDFGDA